jgi:hypothetical protein
VTGAAAYRPQAGPVSDWIYQTVRDGAAPPAELAARRVYHDGQVPSSPPMGYFVVGDSPELPGLRYGQPGGVIEVTTHGWAADRRAALTLWTWYYGLFAERVFVLSSGYLATVRAVELTGIFGETDGPGPRQAQIRLTVEVTG